MVLFHCANIELALMVLRNNLQEINNFWSLMHIMGALIVKPSLWADVLDWLIKSTQFGVFLKLAIHLGWQACIYCIWEERNDRYHSGLSQPPLKVGYLILESGQSATP